MNIEAYSSRYFKLSGASPNQKEVLLGLGGSWNSHLSCWLFQNVYRKEVEKWLENNKILVVSKSVNYGFLEEEDLVLEFSKFLHSKYNSKLENYLEYNRILVEFIESQTQVRTSDDTDIYFNSHENKLVIYFCEFFAKINRPITFGMYSNIDIRKFIEYALLLLIKKYCI